MVKTSGKTPWGLGVPRKLGFGSKRTDEDIFQFASNGLARSTFLIAAGVMDWTSASPTGVPRMAVKKSMYSFVSSGPRFAWRWVQQTLKQGPGLRKRHGRLCRTRCCCIEAVNLMLAQAASHSRCRLTVAISHSSS